MTDEPGEAPATPSKLVSKLVSEPVRPPRPRDPQGHKGTFGTVGVFGGSASEQGPMIGAPALAAIGAFRAGAGRVWLGVPRPIAAPVLTLCPSATARPFATEGDGRALVSDATRCLRAMAGAVDALVIGPGLGDVSSWGSDLFRATENQKPTTLVVDADALTALASVSHRVRLGRRSVLTPHPGEASRLARAYGVPLPGVSRGERLACAYGLSIATRAVVVLKGSGTVVCDGTRAWVCERGHHCLATGGMGDVLAGVLGALAAYSGPDADLFEIARTGAEAHALAGELWARGRDVGGAFASEIADHLPEALWSISRAGDAGPSTRPS